MFKTILECRECGHEHTLEIPRDKINYTPGEPRTYDHPGCDPECELDIADAIPCGKCGAWIKIDRADLERGAAKWMEMTIRDEADAAEEAAEERWTEQKNRHPEM